MTADNDFWQNLQTYETLRKRTIESISEVDFELEKASSCMQECERKLSGLAELRPETRKYHPDLKTVQNAMLFALSRAKDYIDYTKRGVFGSCAEINLMEKLLNAKIDSRFSGESTAIDVFAKVNEKIVLIQVKATSNNERTVTEEEIRDLLTDSIFFEKYPVIDIAFSNGQTFDHFFVPIEEIMAYLKRKSLSLTRNRLQKILNLDFPTFESRMKQCSFPIMKFDKTQFQSWIDKLDNHKE